MKSLSDLMNQRREHFNQPSFLNESIRESTSDTPIEVSYNPSWEKNRGDFNKSFNFKSREELKTFCSYVLDFEVNSGVLFDLRIYSSKNRVDVSLSSFQSGGKTKKTLSRIDAIRKDTRESFRKYV